MKGPLAIYIGSGGTVEIMNGEVVIESSDICCLDLGDGDTRIHLAAVEGNITRLRKYYSDDPAAFSLNVNRKIRPLGVTPLRLAVCRVQVTSVKFLLEHGADVDISDNKGQTPLFHAVVQAAVECVDILLKAGASPNGSSLNLVSPLRMSIFQRRYSERQDIIYLHLLKYGADILREDFRKDVICVLCLISATASAADFLSAYYQFGGGLRQCTCGKEYTKSRVKDLEMAKKIKDLMATPLTLKSLCRLTVRSATKGKSVTDLPVPSFLLNYLMYADFDLVT